MRGYIARLSAPAISRHAAGLLVAGALLLTTLIRAGELSPYTERAAWTPVFTLEALDGATHRLEDYRGEVVLVNFWASWCPPCLAELPSMQRLRDRMADIYPGRHTYPQRHAGSGSGRLRCCHMDQRIRHGYRHIGKNY